MHSQQPLFDLPEPDQPSPATGLTLTITGRQLGPAQKQFNQWLKKIEALKAALLNAQRLHAEHLPERARRLDPLMMEIWALQERMVLFLHQRLQTPKGLSKKIQQDMTGILLSLVDALMGAERASPEVEAIYEDHAPPIEGIDDLDAMDDDVLMAELRDSVSASFGIELNEDTDIDSPEALMEAMLRQARAQQEAAEQARAARQARRKQTPRQQQQLRDAQDAEKAVRDIYRKLASALHPDRAADDAERACKAELMAQVNAANDQKDLLALLQLQLQIEQLNPQDVAAMAEDKLRHFNRLLKEQAQSLQQQVSLAEHQLRTDFELGYNRTVTAQAIDTALRSKARHMQQTIAAMKRDLADIQQDAALKRWVKDQAAAMDEPLDMLDLAELLRQR